MWKRRARWAPLFAVVVTSAGVCRAEDTYDALARYAKDKTRNCIRRDELVAYLLTESPLLKAARDRHCPPEELRRLAEHRADGVLGMAWANSRPNGPTAGPSDCGEDGVSLERADALLRELARSRVAARGCQGAEGDKEGERSSWGTAWSNLTLKRELTDSFDPRRAKIALPAVVSYLFDQEATEQRHQTTIIGAVAYQFLRRDFGLRKRNTLSAAVGLDADIEPTKPTSSNVVDAGVNLSYQWASETPQESLFESVLISATPKLVTDSALKSRVYQVSLTALPTSKPLAIAQPISIPLGLRLMIEASAGLDYGRVLEAGDNAKLAAIEASGAYVRPLAQVRAKVWPPTWSQSVSLVGTYTLRYDAAEHWRRSFLEVLLEQDLDGKGTFAATLAYRRGRKPPDFAETKQLLFGIGVKK